jgi:hypothetical protein
VPRAVRARICRRPVAGDRRRDGLPAARRLRRTTAAVRTGPCPRRRRAAALSRRRARIP